MEIVWRGNEHTNKSSRSGHKPIAIVNHITAGSAMSCDAWFRSPGNKASSAHFLVQKDGGIKQYVRIEDMAWANGLKTDAIPQATSALIREMRINPNKYTISIEHEGTDGFLTPAQFEATVWLHRYIRDYVRKVYGHTLVFDRKHILGHYEIDPKRKPNCPGPYFPWDKLMARLVELDAPVIKEDSKVETPVVPQWKIDVMKQAEDLGIIVKGQHAPLETADKAFVVAVVLNALKGV